ncbi:DUF4181 domain-containing protein [Paucisalibacillus sp. EB02]|uniref:DUF4181 domain-containing protein n=1 Tax=Paucisalibacillus sp. EB02 TaxID=1347087 RepID=UPI0005A5DEDB|nr:DUF4181 domain-containing protein [Paucisalibacillus sp. EB02]
MNIFVITVLVIIFIINTYLKKKFDIEQDFAPLRYYSKTHKWVERTLFIGFVILIVLVYITYTSAEIYLFLGYAVILFGFRTTMEYKYEREEKEYLLTLVLTIGVLVLFVGSIFFVHQSLAPYKVVVKEIESLNPESIQQVEVINHSWNEKARDILNIMEKKREVVIEDKETITKLLSELSAEQLRVRDVNIRNKDSYYELNLKGDIDFRLTVYEKSIIIVYGEMDSFQVVGNNRLYQMLQEDDLEWAIP